MEAVKIYLKKSLLLDRRVAFGQEVVSDLGSCTNNMKRKRDDDDGGNPSGHRLVLNQLQVLQSC